MIRRREFIVGLGSTAAWPLGARAQQGDRVRRIGVLIGSQENDPLGKPRLSAFPQALADLGWTDGHNVRMDIRLATLTQIGYGCSRRNWSACNPTSS
jgi:putative ABC transport system substrate-binding protein